jgi:hypothetical protein
MGEEGKQGAHAIDVVGRAAAAHGIEGVGGGAAAVVELATERVTTIAVTRSADTATCRKDIIRQ